MTWWNQILQTSGCHIQSWKLERVTSLRVFTFKVVYWQVLGVTRLVCSALPEHTCIITEESGSAEHFSVNNGDHSESCRLFLKFSTLNVTSRSLQNLIPQSHVNAVQTPMKEYFFNQHIRLAPRVAKSPPRSIQLAILQTEVARTVTEFFSFSRGCSFEKSFELLYLIQHPEL